MYANVFSIDAFSNHDLESNVSVFFRNGTQKIRDYPRLCAKGIGREKGEKKKKKKLRKEALDDSSIQFSRVRSNRTKYYRNSCRDSRTKKVLDLIPI